MKSATFNQLVIFQTIVEQGTIRGAARKLELAVPTVSQALKQLEQQLGLPLFHRTTRKIELTDTGQLLYQQITGAVATLDCAMESVRDLAQRPSGKVSITLPRFAYQFFFRSIFAEFCQRYPDIQLEISVLDETVDILGRGIDVGIRFGDKVKVGMVARPLTPSTQEALFAAPDYLTRYGSPRTLEDLQQHKLVQYRFIASNQIAPLNLCCNDQNTVVQMSTALIVNDTDAMLDAAVSGLGIGRMVTPVLESYFADGRLCPVLEAFWPSIPGLSIYFIQNSQKAARVRVLIDFLAEKGSLT